MINTEGFVLKLNILDEVHKLFSVQNTIIFVV